MSEVSALHKYKNTIKRDIPIAR